MIQTVGYGDLRPEKSSSRYTLYPMHFTTTYISTT
jgi:hypothetical protein